MGDAVAMHDVKTRWLVTVQQHRVALFLLLRSWVLHVFLALLVRSSLVGTLVDSRCLGCLHTLFSVFGPLAKLGVSAHGLDCSQRTVWGGDLHFILGTRQLA